jgi:hypothetical protein
MPRPRTPVKLSVEGPRLVPVLAPQPLPMPLEKWCEELERLGRAMEMIALLAEQDLKRPAAQSPKS